MTVIILCSAKTNAQAAATTATLAITGSEQFPNGTPDSGSLTVAVNGTTGYTETILYGQYSTPASLASGLAAAFCRDYSQFGLYAKAGANNNTDPTVITFQFTQGQPFASINYTPTSPSFAFSAAGFPVTNPPSSPAPVISLSLTTGPASMGVIITGDNLGIGKAGNSICFGGSNSACSGGTIVPGTWVGTTITFQVPANSPLGIKQVVLTVQGQASNTATFTVVEPFSCPTT